GPLAVGGTYQRTEAVVVPAELVGDYWVIAITDTGDAVDNQWLRDNNATICGTVTVNDTWPPETTFTFGPADGALLNITEVTFEWAGTDNFTPVGELVYSSCFWAECDPSAGPFSVDTSYTFHGLDDGVVTIKVVSRDLAGNVDPTPVVRSFTVDLTSPEIIQQTLFGEGYVPVDHVDVTFSETVNAGTFTADDVELAGPGGAIAIDSLVDLGDNVWRIGFASQDSEGQYTVTIGPEIEDLVGNAMEAAYVGNFTIVLPDLEVNNIAIPAEAQTEEEIEVGWTVTNAGSGSAAQEWEDCVYLSDDNAIGDDTPLGCFTRPVELASDEHYDTSAMVTIPEMLPEGDWWIVVVTDANNAIVESAEGVTSNGLVSDTPIALTRAPRPDLVVTGLTPPPNIPAGTLVEVVWTVTNIGTAPAVGPWNERIAGSTDDTIGDDNAGANEYRYAGILQPGDSLVRIDTYQVPDPAPSGDFWIVVCVDTAGEILEFDDDNNCAIAEVCIDCEQPDLVVTDIVGPAEAAEFMNVQWTVRNDGNETAYGVWTDQVYLSEDMQAGDDILVGEFMQLGPLADGVSYTGDELVPIPVDLEGTYYLVVLTDALNDLPEPGGEGNNSLVSSNGVVINQADLPDLVVTGLTAPAEGVTGELVDVSWAVANNGELAADGSWIDRVYLSADDQLDAGDEIMALFAPPGLLDPTESYPGSVQFALPDEPGSYWVIVHTDANDNIEEGLDDNNNVYVAGVATVVNPAPRPDLVMVEVIAAAGGEAGGEVPVQWTVRNDGNAEAAGGWFDRVYVSTDAVPGDDLQLAEFERVDPLDFGEQYIRQENVTVPFTFEGEYYFLVVTDAHDEIDEGADAGINFGFTSESTLISQPDLPDLTVTAINASTSGFTSQSIELTWEVSNIGEWPAFGDWKDRLYVSTDDQWDVGDVQLGFSDIDGPLADGASYVAGGDYVLPAEAGTYWFIVITNSDGDVEEGTDLVNNTYVSPSAITLVYMPRPDLQVTSVEPPATEVSGEPVEVTWTVANTSTDTVATGPWYERLYISPNAQIGNDSLVANIFYDETLQPGESVVRHHDLTTPYMPEGYYLVVCVDAASDVIETNEDNNCAIAATASQIELPDLVVSGVVAPADATADGTVQVSWTLTNAGGATTYPFHWIDA
ncbi:MAG: Ig-like domain-containing protein, partial [Phycisphaerae bacterium]|nr:Ig-like domain-containing protein [Phycisphaerae bacterium]